MQQQTKLESVNKTFEYKLAHNLKSHNNSFNAYVRSKQNVRDKVGPLEDNAGNIITEGFVMADELNKHFSSKSGLFTFSRSCTNRRRNWQI